MARLARCTGSPLIVSALLDILASQLHTVKLIVGGTLAETITPSDASRLLLLGPDRYEARIKHGRIVKLIDTHIPEAPAWYPCLRNSRMPVLQPGIDWQRRMGYEVAL